MPSSTPRNARMGVALIIGASRGLGLGLADEYLRRGWRVVATVRGTGRTRLHALADEAGGRLAIEQLDVNDRGQIAALAARLAGQKFDVLFVNAGVANGPDEQIATVSTDDFNHVMTTNALAPMRVIEALHDLVAADGSIAAMSSGLGSIANNTSGGWEVYRASKAALNMLMRSYAARHAGTERSLLVIAPGWVRTDMGGPDASLDVETSIRGVVDTVGAQSGHAGLQFLTYQGATLPW